MNINNFSRYATALQALPADAAAHPSLLISDDGRNSLYYVPFEYINPAAKLVLVGISPGPTQMQIANNTCRELLRKGARHDEIAVRAKLAGAFGGTKFRKNLCAMLDHFYVNEWLGLPCSSALFTSHQELLYSTSIVPHAAFVNGKFLNDSFKTVLKVPAFNECFLDSFVKRIPEMHPDSKFIALGHIPLEGLDWCVEHGHLDPSRVIGAIAHPSGNAGSQVDLFLGRRKLHELKPGDPVRNRISTFSKHYDLMARGMSRLVGRPLAASATTYA